MDEQRFLKNFLRPSDTKLDESFTHTLPKIEGLQKNSQFIVQSKQEETFSTNIVTQYVSADSGVSLLEVYKNTENDVSGLFIRIVGALVFVKTGYPVLFVDAAVSNVSPLTTEKEDLTTRVAIHLPQADPEQRRIFSSRIMEEAKKNSIAYTDIEVEVMPDFWGPICLGEWKGIDFDIIHQSRDNAWVAYKGLIENTMKKEPFDYRPVQEHMIFNVSALEHASFNKMGLSVPMAAQAAYFTLQVLGT